MTLLNRYILYNFIRNLGMIMASFISIYLLIDFFEKIDNFLDKGKSIGLIAQFFLLNIPFIIDQMSPVCILLAGVVTLGILNHSNELIALKASGIPLRKITLPIIAASMVCILLFLAMAQFILPTTNSTTNRIWNQEVRGMVPLGIFRHGRYYYRGQEGFYSFARPDPTRNIFTFFSYTTWDEHYQADKVISAQRAVWDNDTWTLRHGQTQKASGDGRFTTEVFRTQHPTLPERPDHFFVPANYTMQLSLLDLYRETRGKASREETNRARAEFYGRISYTMLGLPLLLLGLPMLLLIYRKWGRDLSIAIPVSCGMAFACWGVWATLQSLAKVSYLNPMIAATSIHIFMGLAGLLLLMREDT
ncbi:LptF/LptG family permease [Desulfobulbus alkaliphilus]|uniref:LptF/LptG family permease n=1 Tax=Desulfobulbus alkaliphilus TaxID=869814 RepID=UPI0019667FA2|nr:LptF/LptG family permease [Desulfobulbus alkaliphilus]